MQSSGNAWSSSFNGVVGHAQGFSWLFAWLTWKGGLIVHEAARMTLGREALCHIIRFEAEIMAVIVVTR
jgi:hypothetical protein